MAAAYRGCRRAGLRSRKARRHWTLQSGPPTGVGTLPTPDRMRSITGHTTKATMILSSPPRFGQCSKSISM